MGAGIKWFDDNGCICRGVDVDGDKIPLSRQDGVILFS